MNRQVVALGFAVMFAAGFFVYPSVTAQSTGRRVIQPKPFPSIGLPLSPGILVGDTLYLSGHLGRDPVTTKIVPGGIEAETRQALINMGAVLREAGMDYRDVASVTAFMVDFKDFELYNKVYREFFPKDPPARATVGVSALNQGGRVELQMIAARTR
jgi:2-iminobutanoate/2-iminopropanoate deaminase